MARLLHRLSRREFTVTVEIDPPKGPDPSAVLALVRRFGERVDAVNVADCPMASVRMSPITLAHLIQRDQQVECIFHLTTRDRNLIGLQAELLGAAGLGVSNILCLRGDNPDRGDQPDATGVFQVDASGLIALATALNSGRTLGGREITIPTRFAVGCAANPANPDAHAEVDRLLAKIAAGAHFAQTQPVYDVDDVFRFQEALAARGLADFPVLYGILPLKSYKNALYMATKVPGVRVPAAVVARMEHGDRDEGIRIAGEVIRRIARHVHGVHLFPMNSPRVVIGVLDILEELGLRRSHPALALTPPAAPPHEASA